MLKNKKIRISHIYFILTFIYIATAFFDSTSASHALLGYIAIVIGILTYLSVPVINRRTQGVFLLIIILYGIYCCLSCQINNSFIDETTKGRLISTICLTIHVALFTKLCLFLDKYSIEKVFYVLIIISVFMTFKTYSGAELIQGLLGIVRIGGLLSGINSYGMFMSVLAAFMFYRILETKGKKTKLVNTLVYIVLITLSATSGSRKAIFGSVIVASLLTLFISNQNRIITLAKIVLGASLLLYLLSILNITSGVFERISTIWDDSSTIVGHSDLVRSEMTKAALKGWMEHPLFGNGFNSFTEKSTFGTYSHNNYAELLFNLGLVGTVLYYFPKAYVFYLYIKNRKGLKDNIAYLFISLFILSMLFDFACVSYYDTLQIFIWWFGAAYIVRYELLIKETLHN